MISYISIDIVFSPESDNSIELGKLPVYVSMFIMISLYYISIFIVISGISIILSTLIVISDISINIVFSRNQIIQLNLGELYVPTFIMISTLLLFQVFKLTLPSPSSLFSIMR